jgi:cobyrinic acid a,c-diamide synthase
LDDAFHFYYQDNLDIFTARGAELVPFSPIHDARLPEGVRGVYLGGGYPELSAAALQKNVSMRRTVHEAAEAGMPMFAECGGLMYLMERIVTFDGSTYEMVGLFTGDVVMEKKLSALGYSTGTVLEDSAVAEKGWHVRGHLFHWSRLDGTGPGQRYLFRLEKPGKEPAMDGLMHKNVVAGYFHIHFAGAPHWVDRFIDCCRNYSKKGSVG